jgi:hypothetical protein
VVVIAVNPLDIAQHNDLALHPFKGLGGSEAKRRYPTVLRSRLFSGSDPEKG